MLFIRIRLKRKPFANWVMFITVHDSLHSHESFFERLLPLKSNSGGIEREREREVVLRERESEKAIMKTKKTNTKRTRTTLFQIYRNIDL
jgi:hypothetical protein